jgi:hypothetical protein
MLEACGLVAVLATLSTTIPLVEPASLTGIERALVTTAGGQVGLPVTSMDIRHPKLSVRQVLPAGIGSALLARFPMLKKIQSLATPVPPPLGLYTSYVGFRHRLAKSLGGSQPGDPILVVLP